MGTYSSYYYYKKYVKYGNQDPLPVIPEEYSVDGDGTMPYLPKSENDPECGYTGQTATYRWVNIDISVDYVCLGTSKYYKQKKQVSYDSGTTWSDVTPPEYQTGGLYETGSTDCSGGGGDDFDFKVKATYTGGNTKKVPCNSSDELTREEVLSDYPLSSMTSVVIGNCVKTISCRVFYNETTGYTTSSLLTSVTLANTVETIGCEAFFGQGSITTVSFQSGSALKTIEDNAFANYKWVYEGGNPCYYWLTGSSLSNITFPNGLREIGHHAFSLSRLTSINLPDSLETIGTEAFWGITTLRTVSIGTGITSIGKNCFNGSSGITSMTIHATVPPTLIPSEYSCRDWDEEEWHTCYNYEYIFDGSYPIYVPAASVDTYKVATGWSTYASRIFPISS